MSTIRRYTDDFKRDAVAYVQDHPDITMQEAADSLGMPKETLYGGLRLIVGVFIMQKKQTLPDP